MYRIFGADPKRFNPSKGEAISRFHPEDQPRVGECVQRSIETGAPIEFEARVIRDDGEVRTLQSIGRAETDAAGKTIRIFGVSQDVTARKRGEQLVRDRERKLSDAQSIAHVGNWEWEVTSGKVVWSDEMYRIVGVDPATYTPTYDDYIVRVHPADRPGLIERVERSLKDGRDFE